MLETNILYCLLIFLIILFFIIIYVFTDYYNKYQVIINLNMITYIFIVLLCIFYSKKKRDFKEKTISPILYGFKLLFIIITLSLFCKIITFLFFNDIKITRNIILYLLGFVLFIGIIIFILIRYKFSKVIRYVLLTIVGLLSLYYLYILRYYPYLYFLPKSIVLLSNPIYINTKKILRVPYDPVNTKTSTYYNYAFSCWIYINPHPPSTGYSYSKDTTIFTFIPHYQYNKFIITFNNLTNKLKISNIAMPVITIKQFEMQKWNNLIFNRIGNTTDIFMNNKLVNTVNSSFSDVVDEMDDVLLKDIENVSNLDNKERKTVQRHKNDIYLSIGSNSGIDGGICNVQYYKKNLTKNDIFNIYNFFKYKTPPI